MAATGSDELRNPFTGQTIRFLEETDELLVMESSYAAGGAPAPAHLHPAQAERFELLSGTVSARVGGEARTLREGDVLEIPAGTPHEFGGHPEEPGTVRWEVRPPLRTREFFERLHGALNAANEGREPDEPFDVADYADVFRIA
jgi:quercetin dioxygenase-like cupin family protein